MVLAQHRLVPVQAGLAWPVRGVFICINLQYACPGRHAALPAIVTPHMTVASNQQQYWVTLQLLSKSMRVPFPLRLTLTCTSVFRPRASVAAPAPAKPCPKSSMRCRAAKAARAAQAAAAARGPKPASPETPKRRGRCAAARPACRGIPRFTKPSALTATTGSRHRRAGTATGGLESKSKHQERGLGWRERGIYPRQSWRGMREPGPPALKVYSQAVQPVRVPMGGVNCGG